MFFSTHLLVAQSCNLIWNDEFNTNQLDSTKWTHDIGTGSQYGLYGWGNSELQYYQSSNTEVYSGSAKIIAKEEPNGIVDSWGNTMYYSSSKITTKGIFDFKYGKVEAKIKTVDGQGFWPAFWMLPTGGNWPCDGEIDIMEQWGSNGPSNTTTGAAHLGTCPGGSIYQSFSNIISNGSYADNFHIYSIQWHPDHIAWYVDNVQFFQVTPSSYPSSYTWPFNSNNWYLMINLAIISSGPDSSTVFPSQIEIDYVRVYANNGISGCTNNTAINYNPNANLDDGSCCFVSGCTDVSACYYDPLACHDDGSCEYPDGCTDYYACNYDSTASCDDGSCLYLESIILQSGDSLFAITNPVGLSSNWYNIQNQDTVTRIWLMEENSETYMPTFDCSYFIIVEDDNGCIDTSSTYYFGANATKISSFVTSPNPTSGFINVKFKNFKNQFVYLNLMNGNGVKLDDFITKNTELDIDISKYPSGTYYLYFDSSHSEQGCSPEDLEMISTKIILNK